MRKILYLLTLLSIPLIVFLASCAPQETLKDEFVGASQQAWEFTQKCDTTPYEAVAYADESCRPLEALIQLPCEQIKVTIDIDPVPIAQVGSGAVFVCDTLQGLYKSGWAWMDDKGKPILVPAVLFENTVLNERIYVRKLKVKNAQSGKPIEIMVQIGNGKLPNLDSGTGGLNTDTDPFGRGEQKENCP